MTSQYNLSQIGQTYAQTAAEISAGVTPSNYGYQPGDVRRYGADVTGSADSTTAIQSAVAQAQAGGAVEVVLPSGTFKITSAIVLTGAGNVWITGTWSSIIKNTGTGNAITAGNLSTDYNSDIQLLGFKIEGQAGTAHGIHFMRIHNARIDGVRVYNCDGDGIHLDACYALWVIRAYSNNNTGNGLAAIAITGVGNDFLQIHWSEFLANGAKGIYIDNRLYGPAGQRVELNDIEGNAIGFQMDIGSASNTEGFVLRGNYFENQNGYNVSIGEDGGTAVINCPNIESNSFNFGTTTSSAAATRFGASVKELTLLSNDFVNSDLVVNSSVTLGMVSGNKSTSSVPGGFDANGGTTITQLRLYQAGGGAYSAISMVGGYIIANYSQQWPAAIYPGAANSGSGVYQTACGLWAGTGAPSNSYGQTGDYYFRSDTPASANQRVYVKNGGTWTGIV